MEPSSKAICERCGGPATVVLRGSGVSERFCLRCLDQREPTLSLGSILRGLRRPRSDAGRCPHCGWTTAEVTETGLLGCPLCYESLGWKQVGPV